VVPLSSVPRPYAHLCPEVCQTLSSCVSYSWDSTNSQCTFYSISVSILDPVPDPAGLQFYDAACPVPPYPSLLCNFPALVVPPYSNFIVNFLVPFPSSCAQMCATTDGCVAYMHYPPSGQCALYSASVAECDPPYDETALQMWWDMSCPTPTLPALPVCNYPADPVSSSASLIGGFVMPSLTECEASAASAGSSYSFDPSIGECKIFNAAVSTIEPTYDQNVQNVWFDTTCPPTPTCGFVAGPVPTQWLTGSNPAADLQACAESCYGDSSCASYAYDNSGVATDANLGVCALFYESVGTVSPPTGTSEDYFNYYDLGCTCSFLGRSYGASNGYATNLGPTPNEATCATECASTTGCLAYGYDKRTMNCVAYTVTLRDPSVALQWLGGEVLWSDKNCPHFRQKRTRTV
jgi:PAN domain